MRELAFFASIYTAEVKHSMLWVNIIIFRPENGFELLALVFVAKNCETLLVLLLLDMTIFKIPSNRFLFLAMHTRKFQSYLCCPSELPHRFLIDD